MLAVISLAVSGVALILSSLLERRSSSIAFHAKEIPVAADVFREFRSPGFRAAMERMAHPRDTPPDAGFQGLSEDERDEAYTVCYFFEYLGVLVAFQHVSEDMALGTMATQLTQTWTRMLPWIEGERRLRRDQHGPGTGSLFLPYFEHLVARLEQRRRRDGTIKLAGVKLRRVRRIVHNVVHHPRPAAEPAPTTQTVHGSE